MTPSPQASWGNAGGRRRLRHFVVAALVALGAALHGLCWSAEAELGALRSELTIAKLPPPSRAAESVSPARARSERFLSWTDLSDAARQLADIAAIRVTKFESGAVGRDGPTMELQGENRAAAEFLDAVARDAQWARFSRISVDRKAAGDAVQLVLGTLADGSAAADARSLYREGCQASSLLPLLAEPIPEGRRGGEGRVAGVARAGGVVARIVEQVGGEIVIESSRRRGGEAHNG